MHRWQGQLDAPRETGREERRRPQPEAERRRYPGPADPRVQRSSKQQQFDPSRHACGGRQAGGSPEPIDAERSGQRDRGEIAEDGCDCHMHERIAERRAGVA
jgi:hypothetical protein